MNTSTVLSIGPSGLRSIIAKVVVVFVLGGMIGYWIYQGETKEANDISSLTKEEYMARFEGQKAKEIEEAWPLLPSLFVGVIIVGGLTCVYEVSVFIVGLLIYKFVAASENRWKKDDGR